MTYDDRDRRNAEAAAESDKNGWPALTGSHKQADWATTIRSGVLATLRELVGPFQAAHFPGRPRVAEELTDILLGRTGAPWWIELREMGPVSLAAGVDLPRVLRALDAMPALDTGLPHTSAQVYVPVQYTEGDPWPRVDTVRGAVCSCGWSCGTVAGAFESFTLLPRHIQALPREDLVTVAQAHPETPHGCPDSVGTGGHVVPYAGCSTQNIIRTYVESLRRKKERVGH
ncbi:hypothetical protein ACFWXO_05125 [Kitasatospora sp. NPDC059088]|uniref:hypothetical protein n=1 Tax=Kitasatospora sp. NPDC059088 TaxID=3346722 RepID=UPI0036C8EB51